MASISTQRLRYPLVLASLLGVTACVAAPLAPAATAADPAAAATDPVAELRAYLATPDRPPLDDQPFARAPLSRAQAAAARQLLVDDWYAALRAERAAELERRELVVGDKTMRLFYVVRGDRPAGGRSLYISMHGGGEAPAELNDQQWVNQQHLYAPAEGVYVAPRAPTNTWNLWHEAHIDELFGRLIEDMIVLEDVDPNRVYLLGYSAGGDGVYQLAPRLADRLAAAAMMAGHPNEASPLGLRNIGFSIQVGAEDDGYDRNKVAAVWQRELAALAAADPDGYRHVVTIHAGKGHWMDGEDAAVLPWLAGFTRDPYPTRAVWLQDDVTRTRFYWLAIDPADARAGAVVRASRAGQDVELDTADVPQLELRLADAMLDLDAPVTVRSGGAIVFQGKVDRTIGTLARTLWEPGGDPAAVYEASVRVTLGAPR